MNLTPTQIDRIRAAVKHAEFQAFQPEHQCALVKHTLKCDLPHFTSMGRAIQAAITETLEQEKDQL